MRIYIILLSLFFFHICNAQNSWIPLSTFPGNDPVSETTFSLGNSLYVVSAAGHKQCWEYNTISGVWTQKADYSGPSRNFAVSFGIFNKGFVGLGTSNTLPLNDVYQYNPSNNSWILKTTFPGTTVKAPSVFITNNSVYIACGSPAGNIGNESNELWRYNPSNNSWRRQASLPASGRDRAASFVINGKGYVVAGFSGNSTNIVRDVWAYDPTNDSWSQKSPYPGMSTNNFASFSLNNHGYVGLGYPSHTDFWRYDATSDTWTQLQSFWGSGRLGVKSESINDYGYLGFGGLPQSSGSVNFNDIWRFEDTTLGVEDQPEVRLNFYPNPVINYLNIQDDNLSLESAYYNIYNLNGAIVKQGILQNSRIDLSDLKPSMYVLKIELSNQTIKSIVVKQ